MNSVIVKAIKEDQTFSEFPRKIKILITQIIQSYLLNEII
jgi:hypothetical protein